MTHALGATLPHAGDVLGDRYRLTERIGAGGMGRVYRARDHRLQRDVAVKLFYDDPAVEAERERRLSEAHVLASLYHPSLVTLYDARLDDDEHAYLVMELIEGPTLRRRIEDGPLLRSEVAAILSDLADGLAAVHRAGVVHRDVKPSNVLLRPAHGAGRPTAVLADFGVAHLVDTGRVASPGTVIGTAAYLAPEQVRGERSCAASDVYSLGLLTLEALTRLHPFGGGDLETTVRARLDRQPEIPGELGYAWKSLLTAMTAPDPASRPTAHEVAERAGALLSVEEYVPVSRRDLRALAASTDTAPATAPTPALVLLEMFESDESADLAEAAQTSPDRPRRRWPWAVAATVAAVTAGGIAASALSIAPSPADTGTPAPGSVAATTAPTPGGGSSRPIVAPVIDRVVEASDAREPAADTPLSGPQSPQSATTASSVDALSGAADAAPAVTRAGAGGTVGAAVEQVAGRGAEPPGAAGPGPGSSDAAPATGDTPPGRSGDAPGRGDGGGADGDRGKSNGNGGGGGGGGNGGTGTGKGNGGEKDKGNALAS